MAEVACRGCGVTRTQLAVLTGKWRLDARAYLDAARRVASGNNAKQREAVVLKTSPTAVSGFVCLKASRLWPADRHVDGIPGETPRRYDAGVKRDILTYILPTRSGRNVEYELGPTGISGGVDSVAVRYDNVRRVELEQLGDAGYHCHVRGSNGEHVRIVGPIRAQHAFAAFVDELCLRLADTPQPVLFFRGNAVRFTLSLFGMIAGITTALGLFVATAAGGVFGVGSGWVVALPAVGAVAFVEWMASQALRHRPARYEPGRLPFGLSALIGKRAPD